MLVQPSVRPLRATCALLLLAASTVNATASEGAWEPLPRLVDVRYEQGRDLTPFLLAGREATLPLPFGISVDGRWSRALQVGPDAVRFVASASETMSLEGVTPGAADAPGGTTLQVVPRGLVQLDPGSTVVALSAPDGVAIRWSRMAGPDGLATYELLIDRQGRATVQHLRVPAPMAGLRAGLPGKPLSVRPASASRIALGSSQVVTLPATPVATPKRSDPPPAGCTPETGTWCDRADGPGTSVIWLNENFDDLAATSRGWTASGLWHPVSFPTCTPGASFDPGGSMYFGNDGTCSTARNVSGSLISPTFGPVTAGSLLAWSSRWDYEGFPFELAQIVINGTRLDMPPTNDPGTWFPFQPFDLTPWAGQMVTVEFYYETDATDHLLGWFVDDVIAWDPNVAEPDCVKMAGHPPYAACDQRQATSWSFNEAQFCQNCPYSFYVLVECGREMHLPLSDMEGADIRITNVENPLLAPPLRCFNQTALADAGLAPYVGYNVIETFWDTPACNNAFGQALADCCPATPDGVPELWWAPAFDVTDNLGPGHVAWGLADGCPVENVYDVDACPGIQCSELPATCGGVLPLVSPGENQIMDCFIQDDTGLCGLYRVDVISGGNIWTLFANCDGDGTPQFPIFFDCTEAWAAYDPLPELTLANLSVTGSCPDSLLVEFDVVNIGCAEHPGDVTARITAAGADASCGLPANVFDELVTGPFGPGSTTRVSRTVAAPCTPTRVDVLLDPTNAVAECTETPGAAACRPEGGVDTVSSFTCGCTAQLTADAGTPEAGCLGEIIRLDASGSTVTGCATRTVYRWLDEAGAVVSDWGPSPAFNAPVRCPAGRTYTVEIACEGEPCTDTSEVTLSCIEIAPAAGDDMLACDGDSITLTGAASTITNCAAPIYRWFDGAGNEVRGWTPDPAITVNGFSCDVAGEWLMEVGCEGETCAAYDLVQVSCVQVLAQAGPDLPACEDVPVTISGAGSTATNCTDVLYQWFDTLGNPMSDVLVDPEFAVTLTGCPGVATLVLVSVCADTGFESCGTFDVMQIACGNPAAPVPVVTPDCTAIGVACGVSEPDTTYWWDADTSVDSDGNGDPADDRDLAGCDGALTYRDTDVHRVRAWAEDVLGCRSFAEADATMRTAPSPPVPTAAPGCPGADVGFSCGSAEPIVSWDLDTSADSDGDTVPDNDADATTCDVARPYPAGRHEALVKITTADGCGASARISFDVAATTEPPEVQGDRATRTGSALTLTWQPTPGAATYRVARGTIGTWYSHVIDAGVGTCDTGGATTWTHPTEATDGADWYYLITAVEPCGLEGTPGFGTDGTTPFERPDRTPTPACP